MSWECGKVTNHRVRTEQLAVARVMSPQHQAATEEFNRLVSRSAPPCVRVDRGGTGTRVRGVRTTAYHRYRYRVCPPRPARVRVHRNARLAVQPSVPWPPILRAGGASGGASGWAAGSGTSTIDRPAVVLLRRYAFRVVTRLKCRVRY